jgi:putative endonuclease
MTNKNYVLGQQGEEIAVRYLQANNYRVITRNFFSSYGEIDIIALKDDTLIFLEVKTRSKQLSQAWNSVSASKQRKMRHTASHFINAHPEYEHLPTRFDVIALIFQSDTYSLKHMIDAFT